MSDLFHEDVPTGFIKDIFDVMRESDIHQFQILTKRSERLLDLNPVLDWPPNVWLGVSVENDDYTYRIDDLRQAGAVIKFICFEPLLGAISHLGFNGVDWVIVGGESGPGARAMSKDWAIAIRDKCIEEDIPFFFKQWGGKQKKKAGRLLDGRLWNQMPAKAAGIPLFAK
jgi:protein gp37